MVKIFWVECPTCGQRWTVDIKLKDHPKLKLICPKCKLSFPSRDARWTDERSR